MPPIRGGAYSRTRRLRRFSRSSVVQTTTALLYVKGLFDPGVETAEFAESVSLAAVVDVGHHHVTRLIEAEKDAPLADAQAIPAFQRTLQRLDVAATGSSKRFQGVNNTFRVLSACCVPRCVPPI